jgi:signal transduction histidine kinase
MLAGEIDHYTHSKRFVRKDGGVVHATVFVRCFRRSDGTVDHILALIEDVTKQKQSQEALEQERRTLEHMLRASDHERQLIAYDIHDGLAQELAGAIMQFQIYAHARETKSKDAAKAFDAGMTMLQQSHFEARRLISGVRPPILDESGVMAAIAHLVYDPAFDKGPKVDFRSRVTFNRLAPVLENVVYRIVQEGLTNARSHSKSKKIVVSLVQRGDRLRIAIRDWGVGFDPKTVQENRFGLEGIRERARLLGGKCSIKSKPGEGTSIVVELPVVERESEE